MTTYNYTRIFLFLIITSFINSIAIAADNNLLKSSMISCGESSGDPNPYTIKAQDDPEFVTHTITIDEETLPLVLNKGVSDSTQLSLSFTASSDIYDTVLISGQPVEMTLFRFDRGPVTQKLVCEVEY